MPDYSTNVIFRLSVAGDEALNELRSYLSGMKQLLGELNASASSMNSEISGAANATAAMGASLGDIATKGTSAAEAMTNVAKATRDWSAAQREAAAQAKGVSATGTPAGYAVTPYSLMNVDLTSPYKLAQMTPEERNMQQVLRGQRYGISLMSQYGGGYDEAAEDQWAEYAAKQTAQQKAFDERMLSARVGWETERAKNASVVQDAARKIRERWMIAEEGEEAQWEAAANRQGGLRVSGAWHPALDAEGKQPNVIDTFARGAEKASLQMWGVRRIAFDLQQIGQQGMNTTMQMIESLSNAVEVYGEFNDATTRAAATMELPIELMGELEEGVRAASIETAKFSPQQVAEGLRMWAAGTGEVITTSQQLADTLEDTTTLQRLAAMNAVGLEQTMTNAGGVMAAYGMRTDEVNRVASVFNYVAAQTFANVDDLGEAFVFVGPIAAQMGITFEETAAALALLSDSNIKGSKAGRAFRQMLIALADPTKSVDDAMSALLGTQLKAGETWKDLIFQGGEFIGLAEYVDLLAASVENLSSAERAQRLAELSTANALPAMTSLVMEQVEARKNGVNVMSVYTKILENNVDAEVRAYAEMYEAQTGYTFSTQGALARMENQWDRYISSTAGQLDKMKQEWNSALLAMAKPMAEVFLPVLVKVAKAAADVTNALGGEWMGWVAGTTIAVYGLSSALVSVIGQLIQMGALIYTIQEGQKAVGAAGGAWAGISALAKSKDPGSSMAKAAVAIKTALTSGATIAGATIGAALLAAGVTVAALVRETRRQEKIDEFLASPSFASSAFNAGFEIEKNTVPDIRTQQPKFFDIASVATTRYVAKTEEAKQILREITGSTQDWTTDTKVVLEVMERITKEMNQQAKLSLDNAQFAGQRAEEAQIRFFMGGGQYHSPELAIRQSEQDQEMVDAWAQYGQDRQDIIDDYQQQEENLVSDHNEWMVDAEKGLVRQLSDLAESYSKSKAREQRDFDTSRARQIEDFELSQLETIEDAQKEREKATKDHYEELEKLARDHQNNLVDLLEERDVRGITKEMRSYQEDVADSERDYGQTMADSQMETERALADAAAEFNKRLLREDADRLQDLADKEQDYQESVSSAIADYNESVAEQEAELAKNKDKLKKEMAGDLGDLETDMLDSLAKLSGVWDKLNQEMYPKWLSEATKFWEDNKQIWLDGWLSLVGMAGVVAAQDIGLDVDPKWTALPNTGRLAQPRASGGYASYGTYRLGEGGDEFVLNGPTTRLMEERFGSLSQNTFRNIGQTFNFSPVISGVGRQDASAVEGILDRWWNTKQRQIKDMVRA